ncbi:MAG: hypothetical protein R3B09_24125 [Nannocystaceae bacterium]
MPRWDLWLRRLYLWTLTAAAPATALAWLLWSPGQAIGLGFGVALGLVNLHLLGRAAFRMVQGSPDELKAAAGQRFAPLMAALRWPVAALATAFVLWYMPGQPEGLALGFSLAFLGFVLAGLASAPPEDASDPEEHSTAPTPDDDPPDDPAETPETPP